MIENSICPSVSPAATGSVFAIIGVGLWLFVRAEKPMIIVSDREPIDSARVPAEKHSDE
jgi:hypothetical protein